MYTAYTSETVEDIVNAYIDMEAKKATKVVAVSDVEYQQVVETLKSFIFDQTSGSCKTSLFLHRQYQINPENYLDRYIHVIVGGGLNVKNDIGFITNTSTLEVYRLNGEIVVQDECIEYAKKFAAYRTCGECENLDFASMWLPNCFA